MLETKPTKSVRLSSTCIQHIEALAILVNKTNGQVAETLAAGGIRAYMEGVAAQAASSGADEGRPTS